MEKTTEELVYIAYKGAYAMSALKPLLKSVMDSSEVTVELENGETLQFDPIQAIDEVINKFANIVGDIAKKEK